MIDLVIQSGTQLSLWQWLQARGCGIVSQDTDPGSPTFGDYSYKHTAPGAFMFWRNGGKLEATGGETQVHTYFTGFYGVLRFLTVEDMESYVGEWARSNTAVAVLEAFVAYGGEGIVFVSPDSVNDHLESIGLARHEFAGGVEWSSPEAWYLGVPQTGDQRDFGGDTYESLIDNNVYTPTSLPTGWSLVGGGGGSEWAAGVTYAVDDEVDYQGTTYRCIQAHTSIVGWEPPNVPALWEVV